MTEQELPSDERTLQASNKYEALKMQQAVEDEFYARIGVDKTLAIAGQSLGAWTLSASAMESYGIRNVTLPLAYGTRTYIDNWISKRYPDPTKRPRVELLE